MSDKTQKLIEAAKAIAKVADAVTTRPGIYGDDDDDCQSLATLAHTVRVFRAAIKDAEAETPLAGIGRDNIISLLEKQLLADTRIIGVNATVIGDIAADLTDAILTRIAQPPAVCRWTEDKENLLGRPAIMWWNTGCGDTYPTEPATHIRGTCRGCGKPIKEADHEH